MSAKAFIAIPLLCVLCLAAGCGGSDNVEVFPVRGVVNFDGKPMAGGGSIAFIPVEQQDGKAPGGTIAADGTYELTTYEVGDGGMAGDYRVIVLQTVYDEPAPTQDGEAPAPEGSMVVSEEEQIPAIYADATGSPLTATIEATDENTINFDLQRQ